jgi:hypothetical protein
MTAIVKIIHKVDNRYSTDLDFVVGFLLIEIFVWL